AGDGFLWRRKALEKGIRVAVFAGRREEYLPVLELVRSMGWRLVFANSLGFVYASKRDENGSGNQKKMDYAFLGKKEGDRLEGGESGRFVAMRATQLANAGEGSVAMREFKRARELSPGDRRVRVEFASFLAMRGMWREALGEVEGVLRENQREVAALQVGVQSALALGKRQMAWEWAEKLREEQGWDAFSLYLHARAANAVGAAWAEEDSLRKLIGIMEKRGVRVGVYRVFLGQALVQQGLTKEALKEFEAALESGDLAERQEKDVRDWLERLRNF
ncbi:MAG: hypothetical protein NZL93_06790, partial [Chthoniobacterales bacterium]|nr:hypothetical protein [Chthoniobacterales bacterium]